MATPTFTLPAGVDIQVSEGELSITYDGDIVLEQDLGRSLGVVRAGGDLTVRLPEISGDLQAGGTVTCSGTIRAVRVHGRNVVLGDQSITCRTITADETISIGAATLKVDAIVAPAIHLDPTAKGRVTVVESNNERGASKIKGGFSLNEYEELFGDSDTYLAERGVSPLGGAPPVPLHVVEVEEVDVEEVDVHAIEEIDDLDVEAIDEEDEATAGPEASLSDLDEDDELHPKLSEALKRIVSCYDGAEVPPAVNDLQGLVDGRDYDRLRSDITEVWNGLPAFHQQRGIRPHHQVTHAFNIIHGLVQDMA